MLKAVFLLILAAAALYGLIVAAFYFYLGDPSDKAPLYEGVIIADERQRPVASRFHHASTAAEVVEGIDLKGRNIVITGGHSGTGLEAVRALAARGAHVTALARDIERAGANLADMPNVTVEYVDLLKPASIQAFAERFVASGRPLHVLINGAAIMATPLEYDRRGYERQFATNVLGAYELTVRLLPALVRTNGARVVNLASRGHRAGGVLFDDIHFRRTEYSGMRAYAQSKTALILLSVKLDEMLKVGNIRVFAVHPGPVPATDLFAAGKVGYGSPGLLRFAAKVWRVLHATEALNLVRRPKNVGDVYKTPAQGAATTVWAATSAELADSGGVYLEDSNIAPIMPDGSPAPFGVRPWALDPFSARRMLALCVEMTGVAFETP
ncbi:MAG: SDR family NAD(P)-dependent oxidoreductase [Zoogloeaceae bacterium]|nr:SDR family NAD(P)-dependent oxidoreductase [Zoogloeaceae bacterium]